MSGPGELATQFILEAEQFEQQMAAVIEHGEASSWRGAEEVLIAREIAPEVPTSRQAAYVNERPELARKADRLEGRIVDRRRTVIEQERLDTIYGAVRYGAAGALSRAVATSIPLEDTEILEHTTKVSAISQCLDEGRVVSIYGFQRQGKTFLANAVARYRNEGVILADGQTVNPTYERPMSSNPYVINRDDIRQNIVGKVGRPKEQLWDRLNAYAHERGERLFIIFDEVSMFLTAYKDAQARVKQEIEEIIGLSNLDLVVIEHFVKGKPVGEQTDLLPADIQRFEVPQVSGPEILDYLRSHTADARVTFIPEAAAEIHDLAGGWLSLAANIGKEVIAHAIERQPQGRFIFDGSDVITWAEDYIHSGKNTRIDPIWQTLYNLIGNLGAEQLAQIEMIAQSSDGTDGSEIIATEDNFLVRLGLVAIDDENGLAYLRSKLLARMLPDIKSVLEFTARRDSEQ